MTFPYVITYDGTHIPKSENGDWRVDSNDYALLEKLPGKHPSGFRPKLDSMCQTVGNGCSRRTSIMTNVPMKKHKLKHSDSRSPINSQEKAFECSLSWSICLPSERTFHGYVRENIYDGNCMCKVCLLYTSPSPRDQRGSRMPSSA